MLNVPVRHTSNDRLNEEARKEKRAFRGRSLSNQLQLIIPGRSVLWKIRLWKQGYIRR